MRYFFALIISLCLATQCYGWGSNSPEKGSSPVAAGEPPPESTVLFSQLISGSTGSFPLIYFGTRFYLPTGLDTTTITFEPDFATIGTSCDVRFGAANDLTTYIVADTFTPSVGVNVVQVTTGTLAALSYTVGFHCDGGSIRRVESDVDAGLAYRSGSSWNLSSTAARDLKIRILKP